MRLASECQPKTPSPLYRPSQIMVGLWLSLNVGQSYISAFAKINEFLNFLNLNIELRFEVQRFILPRLERADGWQRYSRNPSVCRLSRKSRDKQEEDQRQDERNVIL